MICYNRLMSVLGLIIVSNLVISLGALVGVVSLAVNKERLEKVLLFLVALSTGALMGGAFLHLLPEAVEMLESERVFLVALLAFMGFFLVEKVLHWHHCHESPTQIWKNRPSTICCSLQSLLQNYLGLWHH